MAEVTILHEQRTTRCADADTSGDELWLDAAAIERATGWSCKPQGLCRDDEICVPLPSGDAADLVRNGRWNLAAMWRRSGQPVVHDAEARTWVFGTGATQRAAAMTALQAPDFRLPDLRGRIHELSAYRGSKVFLVSWASWCGCRLELPVWQSMFEELKSHGLVVVAVALDDADAARPWIEAANPGYPCLIDREHHVADLYGLVNVPQAVWIDEQGRIVRPPETAGSNDGFRAMDRASGTVPEDVAAERQRVKDAYLEALRDWVLNGPQSVHVLDAARAASRIAAPAEEVAQAHAHFRLGRWLQQQGRADEATMQLAQAARLHPDSWAIWRQAAQKNERGVASGPAFWARVDALGSRPYYTPADL